MAQAPDRTGTRAGTNTLEEVVVTAPRGALLPRMPLDTRIVAPGIDAPARAQDGAALVRDLPGVAVIRNGPQTGIPQVRGLANERVRILLDGMTLTPACPNHMDPPLHYAAPSSVQDVVMVGGATPVSLGGDSLAGTLVARSTRPAYSTNDEARVSSAFGTYYRGAQDAWGFHGRAAVAGRSIGAAYGGSWQTGNDLRFPGGRVRDTGFRTMQHDVVLGGRQAGNWTADLGISRTRDTGTPSLPMDMVKDDAWRAGLAYENAWDGIELDGRLYLHSTDHTMDNYSLRPAPALATQRMFSPATSRDAGYRLGLVLPSGAHAIRVGNEVHANELEAYQQNAQTGAQQDTLRDATRQRVGTWAEWEADWATDWSTRLGVRNDTVWSGAAGVDRCFPASANDRATFNAAGRERADASLDVAVALKYAPDEHQAYELGFARKNRAPSLLERYLWTPLSASAGQADGRTYTGNLGLVPETGHHVTFTADWQGPGWQVTVTPFCNLVTGYIQALPTSRIVNGQPVLQYQNLDSAELYGADGSARYALDEHFSVRVAAGFVNGRNTQTGDNLYRIAPMRGALSLDHRWGGWESSAEWVLVARQDRVAAYNGETETGGHALLNLRTGWRLPGGVALEVGVENLLDKLYADHLGGVNRVGASDVAVGQRIPGAGRFFHASLTWSY